MPRVTSTLPAPTTPAGAASPPADRPRRSRWQDPRLAVGVALVAGCTLLGARLVGGGSDTVAVWAARGPLQEGQSLAASDLEARQVRFAEQGDADRYLPADRGLPAQVSLARPVGAGELLPRAALGRVGPALTEVPLSLESDAVPSTMRVGSTVDVWVTPETRAGGRTTRSTLVLDDVPVVAAPRTGTSLGPTATRQVIVGVGEDQADTLPATIAALSGGTVVLTVQR